jgi:molybdate transport system substrate-binding protein
MIRFVLPGLLAASLCAFPAGAQSDLSLKILSPGFTANAGVVDLARGYEKQKGIKVTVQVAGMGRILNEAGTDDPPADVIFLPAGLMDQLEANKGIVPGSRTPIGRVRIGLAIRKGQPIPDISTVVRLAAVLKSADAVLYSDPATGSMEAGIIDRMLKTHPEFAGVKGKISTKGEGGEAVMRGEGPMALQLICEIVNHPDDLANAGPVPDELGAYIDGVAAVSARSLHPGQAADWLKYATQPGTYSLWLARGLERAR